ncbi:MAG: SixA phosphatase family protein [Gammaproteobacteria bacterium]
MSKKPSYLLLLRHAKSSWKNDAESDFDRPLAKRGKQEATKVGRWLKQQQPIPDLILSSPAKRTRKTILKICAEIHYDADEIRWIPEIYDASLKDLIQVLKNCPDKAKTVMLVGHNPGLEYLLEYLCKTPIPLTDDGKLLTTASLAVLETTTPWREIGKAVADLVSITRAAQME